jgi:hypothetical protein
MKINANQVLLLVYNESWELADVAFDPEGLQGEIQLPYRGSGGELTCRECQGPSPQAGIAPEPTWRQLGLKQFETLFLNRSTAFSVRYTLLFEAFLDGAGGILEGSEISTNIFTTPNREDIKFE